MRSNEKAKVARILGHICLGLAAVIGVLALASWISGRPPELALLSSGLASLTMGIIMVAQSRRAGDDGG
jgi:hypothetical protein